MKNVIESSPAKLPTKEAVVETVIDIFVRTIGFIERKDVSRKTHLAKDFYIYTDDLSLFASEVVRHFGIKPTPEEWFRDAATAEEIADLVLRHLSKGQ